MRIKRKGTSSVPIQQIRPWNSKPRGLCPSVLFFWVCKRSPPFSQLSLNITREVSDYLQAAVLLPGLYKGLFYVVNVKSGRYRSVDIEDLEVNAPVLSPIDSTNAILMRGYRDGYRAYWVNMQDLTFTELVGLELSTRMPTVCYLFGWIYVFRPDYGEKAETSNQKYSVTAKKWSNLKVSPITKFILFAFPYKTGIYLCQSYLNDISYRYFDPKSSKITAEIRIFSSISLPPRSVFVVSPTKELICLTADCDLQFWSWEENTTRHIASTKVYRGYVQTHGYALLHGKEVFWLDENHPEVYCFDVESRERQWRELKE